MSFDEGFLQELVEALAEINLEAIIIGNAAAILHGVPVLTQDVDLLIRDHPQLQNKLQRFAKIFEVMLTRPYEPSSQMIRATGRAVQVDFLLALSSRRSFASVKARAERVRIGKRFVWVAALEDIIAAKEAAGRPKDKAALLILKETLRIQKTIVQKKKTKRRR